MPVQAIESIEDYKDGKVVNLFGWKCVATESTSFFHGLAVQLEELAEAVMVELENEIISAFSGVAVTVSEAGVIQELLGVPPETKGRVILVQYENPKLDLWTWIHFQKMHPDFKAQVILFWLRWIAKLEVQRAYQA